MVTKAEILSIDSTGNTCEVRIPIFEHAGLNTVASATATIVVPGGIYNNYRAGDVVIIAFDRDLYNEPVILGKLYLGADKEKNTPGGAIKCTNLEVTNEVILPANTKIKYDQDNLQIDGTTASYGSITDIINRIQNISSTVSSASSAESSFIPYTSVAYGPCQNARGIYASGFTAVRIDNYYLILYNGSEQLNSEIIKAYMLHMTGVSDDLLKQSKTNYSGAFIFANGTTWYPDRQDNLLKLVGINTESFTTGTRVREIIEEYFSTMTTTDISDGEHIIHTVGEGANVTEIAESTKPESRVTPTFNIRDLAKEVEEEE